MVATTPLIRLQPEGIEIARGVTDLEQFRKWARSDAFPEQGRIDWLDGEIEVDMAPEDLFTHGTVKVAIAGGLRDRVEVDADLGVVFVDSTRYSEPSAGLSVEPDVVLVLLESLAAGRVRLVPKEHQPDRFVEIEGQVDLIVECVSDSSVQKDTDRLVGLYERAGVREYWLVDARGVQPSSIVHRLGADGDEICPPTAKGYARSAVLGMSVRLNRFPGKAGIVRYRLEWED